MSANALEIRGLVKRYRKRTALDGLRLDVPKGSLFGLIGSNGAGKTTTLSIIAGLLKSQAGSVNILGDGPFDTDLHSGRVSMMPQDSELPREAFVAELLTFYGQMQGLNLQKATDEAKRMLKLVNLTDRANSKVSSLSHGMKGRVAIAQAFIGNPELVLLDEPISGLDPKEVINIRNMLASKATDQTIIISSHNLHEVERVCDYIAFIEKGRMIRQDSINAVTGKGHTLSYRTNGDLPLEQLRDILPDVAMETDNEHSILTCRFSKTKKSASEINHIVLRCLIDNNIKILEMRQGSELEAAYLEQQ